MAEGRLSTARKERKTGLDVVSKDLPSLLERLGSTDDERARACEEALTGRKRDAERALAIATGSPAVQPDTAIGRLRQISQLSVPLQEPNSDIAAELRAAADSLDKTAGSEAGQALSLASLLGSALEHYHTHGEAACPVCGRAGALDEAWRGRAEREVEWLQAQATAASKARDDANATRTRAHDMFSPVPPALAGPRTGDADPESARAAWAAWVKYPDEPGSGGLRRLAEHVEHAWPPLSQAVTALASLAEGELREREDRWTPVAGEVAAWCERARAAEAAARPVPALQAAITWLKNATDDIRNARLAPLGDRAREIWASLRQESNVTWARYVCPVVVTVARLT